MDVPAGTVSIAYNNPNICAVTGSGDLYTYDYINQLWVKESVSSLAGAISLAVFTDPGTKLFVLIKK